jgi:hypothetical protein
MMKKNIGNLEQVIRIVAGLVVIALGIIFQSWWGLVGIVFLLTATIRVCPLYTLLGISSLNDKSTK